MDLRPGQSARYLLGLTLLLVSACAPGLHLSPQAYPPTSRGTTVDSYFGTPVADPYRWMEALEAPAVSQWVAAQNRLAAPYLAQLPQRPWIQQRVTQLYRYERFGVPRKVGAQYFFLRNDGQQNQAALHVAAAAQDLGRRLIDPDSIAGDSTVSLATYVPSPDGRLLAYALSDAGSDWNRWQLRDVATGADLPDVIRDTKFTQVSWARDGSGFYYSRYPGGDDQRQPVILFHPLGQAQERDRQVFAVIDHASRVPEGEVTLDGRYLVITLYEGTIANGTSVLPLDGGDRVEPVFNDYTARYNYMGSRQVAANARGKGQSTELLFTTTRGAARGKVIAVDLGKPAGQRERVVVPEGPDVLEQATLVGERVLAVYLKDAHAQVRRFDAASGAALADLALPGLGSVAGFSGDAESTETYFSYTDYFTPSRIYRLDPRDGSVSLLHEPRIAADLSPYVTEQVFYPSRDGTRIPMFLVHRRDLKRDGRNPVMLYGYGGFDVSMTPGYSGATLVWLEMGGVYAVPNLRGGGEYGEAWHLAGTRAHKQNVFDDFIAAAEYLVRERYTQPAKLAIRGGSNGGLLVAAVLTQRPELFGAALPDVGVLDMLRYHLASANARLWSDDYGLSENEADFRAQRAYSPLHNVAHHACYPPTLVTTAAQDNRVVPWHSFKFAAALQAAQGCARPALIRVETRAGHGAGKPVWMQVEQVADQWSFAAAALGIKPRAVTPAQVGSSSP
jgi:prolyl oligopeptidase